MYFRAKKRKQPPIWKERWGDYDIPRKKDRKRIWFHAVSVGEVFAARPIIGELRELLPDHEIIMTCTTSTGHSVAEPLVGKSIDYLFYFPIEFPRCCVAAMTQVEPAVVVVMETELWLNFLWSAKLTLAKTCVANGRISEKSLSKSKWIRFIYEEIFSHVDAALMQTEADADRARKLGARETKVFGNSKYDEAIAANAVDWSGLGDGPIVAVGSVRGEEEERFVIEALKGISVKIVLAPRHLERTDELEKTAKAAGFETGRRSRGEDSAPLLILDTFGELASLYEVADVAVIGGGFADLGGQNIIQPMAAGCPVICGSHMRNFRAPFESGLARGALKVAATPEELHDVIRLLLEDDELRKSMARAGKALVSENQGASARYANEIAELARSFHASRHIQ
jgi:3-deoxy-D-manno-octulosonic-acid transferase